MINCTISNNFEGIDGVLTSDSFNDVICMLDYLIACNEVLPKYKEEFSVLKYKLLKLSLYDVEAEEIHIRLGLKELALYTTALLTFLPDADTDYFSIQAYEKPIRIWHHTPDIWEDGEDINGAHK